MHNNVFNIFQRTTPRSTIRRADLYCLNPIPFFGMHLYALILFIKLFCWPHITALLFPSLISQKDWRHLSGSAGSHSAAQVVLVELIGQRQRRATHLWRNIRYLFWATASSFCQLPHTAVPYYRLLSVWLSPSVPPAPFSPWSFIFFYHDSSSLLLSC